MVIRMVRAGISIKLNVKCKAQNVTEGSADSLPPLRFTHYVLGPPPPNRSILPNFPRFGVISWRKPG